VYRFSAEFAGVAVVAAAALALIAPANAVLAQYGYHGHDFASDGHGWFGWFMGPLFMILVLVAVVVLVVMLVRWLSGGDRHGARGGPSAKRTALDILDERYARGEIEHDDYEERRRRLQEQ
jgi:putative membrane protein